MTKKSLIFFVGHIDREVEIKELYIESSEKESTSTTQTGKYWKRNIVTGCITKSTVPCSDRVVTDSMET